MKKAVIIYFDRICIFCNSFAGFVAKRDTKKIFKFGYLQDLAGGNEPPLLRNFAVTQQNATARPLSRGKNSQNLNSVIVKKDGKVFEKSTAIITAISSLGFPYNLIKILLIIPQKLRDIFYDFFGRNRYKWFGKKEVCEINKEVRDRLL